MTSLKISLIALASASSIGRLQTMMPPNGACLSVANAFSHASRKSGSLPTPHGFVCFRIATVGFAKFRDQIGGRADVENVVKGKFLAVQFFKMLVEIAVERSGLMRIFAVTQIASRAAARAKTTRPFSVPGSGNCRSRGRIRKS